MASTGADQKNVIIGKEAQAPALDTLLALCKEAADMAGPSPQRGADAANAFIAKANTQIAQLKSKAAPQKVISDANDMVAITVMNCALVYGDKTGKWAESAALLAEAAQYAGSGSELEQKINKILADFRQNQLRMGDLEPLKSVPSLGTIYGLGYTLYGSADRDPRNNSIMMTHYFVILFFIPLIPLGRYRVIVDGDHYQFLGKGRLRTIDKWHLAIALCGLLLFAIFISQLHVPKRPA